MAEITFLSTAVNSAGGARAVAEHFDVSRQAVHSWVRNGIPANRVLELQELTELGHTTVSLR